jgi:hypothetical protein
LQSFKIAEDIVRDSTVWTDDCDKICWDFRNHKAIFKETTWRVEVEGTRWIETWYIWSEQLGGPVICVVEESGNLDIGGWNIDYSACDAHLVERLGEQLKEGCVANSRCNSCPHVHDDKHEETRA